MEFMSQQPPFPFAGDENMMQLSGDVMRAAKFKRRERYLCPQTIRTLAWVPLATPWGAKSGNIRQGGGPRTQMGRGQPLVYIFGHAFKIVTRKISSF